MFIGGLSWQTAPGRFHFLFPIQIDLIRIPNLDTLKEYM